MPPSLPHFFDLDKPQLEALLQAWAMPRFRADQLLKWVYERGVTDPQRMTDFSVADRQKLADGMVFTTLSVSQHQRATDGTHKLLLAINSERANSERGTRNAERKTADSESSPLPIVPSPEFRVPTSSPVPSSEIRVPSSSASTECVMIPAQNESGGTRRTACISSQVGCPVGCRFCASGIGGLEFNLTTGQIVEQIFWLTRAISDLGTRNAERNTSPPTVPSSEIRVPSSPSVPSSSPVPSSEFRVPSSRISNVVFMGMGEPLSNFAAVTKAVRILTATWGFNISARKITISTVGLPAAIKKLADTMDLPITLALSLHAPNDDLRRQLIPWAEYTTVDDLMEAVDYYFQKTGREVTIEYILLGGVNDQPQHAAQLAKITKHLRCHVNLIRYNEVRGLPYQRPATDDVHQFQEKLRAANINVHIRASRGRDISAACGQLRHEASATPT